MNVSDATGRYWGRLLVYALSAVAGSAIGAMLTWASDTTSDANPLTAGVLAALLSLGPAIAIGAAAAVRPAVVGVIAVCSALAMVTMWWLFAFAASESSTSALVFVWGLIAGVPLAVALVIRVRAMRRAGVGRRP